MVSRRQVVFALGVGALSAPFSAFAQPAPGVHRIGFLATRSRPKLSEPDVFYDAFTQGMRDLGYVEGKNLVIEWRFPDEKYARLPGLAAELANLKVEVLVTAGTPATKAAQQATSTIPIVTTNVTDPIASGFAASLARPGGNVTGMSLMSVDLSAKQIELLKSMVPKLTHLAVLLNPGNSGAPAVLKGIQAAAQRVGIKTLAVDARRSEELEPSFSTMRRERVEAVLTSSDGVFISQRQLIAELAVKNRMPSMFTYREHVTAGGLMSYGQNLTEFYRLSASYVDRILKGAKPVDLPIEQPTNIHLVLNRKTAKALGLTIPQDLLLRADEVIE